MKALRYLLLLIAAPMLGACISQMPYPTGTVLSAPATPPAVRPPQVGQQWVYNVRNVFNQDIVDTVTETVVAVSPQIRIQRIGAKAGPLPDEIQTSWGMVLQDPHWSPPQRFQKALPLWPEQLVPGWSNFYNTKYSVLGQPDASYDWGQAIEANEWVQITVPAGNFVTLKFHNEYPNFVSNDVFRVSNFRGEDVWLAPEIGRWVARRSYGRYITVGMSWIDAYWENYYQWELVSWR